jgi:hypothetical protein
MQKTLVALTLGLALTASASFAEPAPAPSPEVLLAQIFAVTGTDAPFQAPAPVPQACGPYCDCPGCYTTATASGTGSSCTNAQSALTTQLRDLANSVCGFACQLQITYTQTCTQIAPGTYQVTGYAKHGCRDSTC